MTTEQTPVRPHFGAILLISVLSLGLFFLFSLLVGKPLALRFIRGGFESWKQVEPPPGRPVHLRLGSSGEVLAEMVNGSLFGWRKNEEFPWVEVQTPSGVVTGSCECEPDELDEDDFFLVPAPPRQPLESIEFRCTCTVETSVYYKFILLDNGEIWKWSYRVNPSTFTFIELSLRCAQCLVSLMLGIGVFLLLFFVLRWPRVVVQDTKGEESQ